jgi:hypothetical protein
VNEKQNCDDCDAQSVELSEKTVTLMSNIDKALQVKGGCSYQILRKEIFEKMDENKIFRYQKVIKLASISY